MSIRLGVVILLMLFCNRIAAQPFVLPAQANGLDLTPNVSYVNANVATPEALLATNPVFKPLGDTAFDIFATTAWYQVEFEQKAGLNNDWFIQTGFPNAPQLRGYILTAKGDWQLIYEDALPFSQRGYQHPTIVLPLTQLPPGRIKLLVEFQTMVNIPLSFTLYDQTHIAKQKDRHVILNSVLISFCLLIGMFSLFQLILTRDSKALALTLSTVVTVIYMTETAGFNFQYLWPDTPEINSYAPPTLLTMVYISYLFFTTQILNLKHFAPRLNKVFYALMLLLSILIIISQIFNTIQLVVVLMVFTAPLPIVTGIWAVKNKLWAAQYYLLGATCNVIFNHVISGLYAIGLIYNSNLDVFVLSKIGFTLELLAFSGALIRHAQSVQQKLIHSERENIAREQALAMAAIENRELLSHQKLEQQKQHNMVLHAQRMDELVTRKNQLLADVSHELRTPLAVLKLQVESLQDDMEPDLPQAYQALASKTTDIEGFITDLYQLAQSDVGALKLNIEEIQICPLLSDWAKEFGQVAAKSDLLWHYECTLDESLTINADAVKLKQVLANLLGNAISYTDKPGKLLMSVSTQAQQLIIQLQDSAPGVAEQEYQLIFQRLYRVDSSRSRQTGGSGLGLAICEGLINAHQGTIGAGPSPLGGITVTVNLPLT